MIVSCCFSGLSFPKLLSFDDVLGKRGFALGMKENQFRGENPSVLLGANNRRSD